VARRFRVAEVERMRHVHQLGTAVSGLSAILTIAALPGCGDDPPPRSTPVPPAMEANDIRVHHLVPPRLTADALNVEELPEFRSVEFVDVDTSAMRGRMRYRFAGENPIRVGHVLGGASEGGYIVRVERVEVDSDRSVVVTVTPADLSDYFAALEFDYTYAPAEGVALPDDDAVLGAADSLREPSDDVAARAENLRAGCNLSWCGVGGGGKALDCEARVGAQTSASLIVTDIRGRGRFSLTEPSLGLEASADFKYKVSVRRDGGVGDIAIDCRYQFLKDELKEISLGKTLVFGVPLAFKLKPFVEGRVNARLSPTTDRLGLETKGKIKSELGLIRGRWSWGFPTVETFEPKVTDVTTGADASLEVGLAAGAKLVAEFGINVWIFRVSAEGWIKAEAAIAARLSYNADSCRWRASFPFGLAGQAGAQLHLGPFRVGPFETEKFKLFERNLGDLSGRIGACTVIPCNPANPGASGCVEDGCNWARCVTEGGESFCQRASKCGSQQTCCAGSCVPIGCSDNNPCTDDICGSHGCVHVPNDAPCEDGLFCTRGDRCSAGSCRSGSGATCTGAYLCEEDNDRCVVRPCRTADDCVAAVPGSTLDDFICCGGYCAPPGCDDGNPCTFDLCSPLGCEHRVLVDETPCDTSLWCAPEGMCNGGLCLPGPLTMCAREEVCDEEANRCVTCDPPGCSDGNPCTDDICTARGCLHIPNRAPCDDGVWCNGADSCFDGECEVHPGNPCPAGQPLCNEDLDRCFAIGGCPGGCDDGNPCTDDFCDAGGCLHSPNTNSCDDGRFCNGREECERGVCVSSGPPCAPGWTCDDTRGCLAPEPPPPCDPRSCDDGNPCTDDGCGPSGCQNTPNAAPCDDGVFCNGIDQCAGGFCTLHAGSPCTPPLTCDESSRACSGGGGCLFASDCGSVVNGPWTECFFYDGPCATTGFRSREVRRPTCNGGTCGYDIQYESEPCVRSTEGASCGPVLCEPISSCGRPRGVIDTYCSTWGEQAVQCAEYTCGAGECAERTYTTSQLCTRDPTGDPCDEHPCLTGETCLTGGVCAGGSPIPGCCWSGGCFPF
jgi:hypothetical protein